MSVHGFVCVSLCPPLCVCVCMSAFAYVYMYACSHACVLAHVCVYQFVYLYVRACLYLHMSKCVCGSHWTGNKTRGCKLHGGVIEVSV